jgi:hypothetical protein
MVVLEVIDRPVFVLCLGLAEPLFVNVVEYVSESIIVQLNRCVEVLYDQRRNCVVDYVGMATSGIDNELCAVVDSVDNTD